MTLAELLEHLPRKGIQGLAFPCNLLGAFRRKSITFCTGVTDERTLVYWLQSRSFTIDLRLPEGAATPPAERQGWVGDTLWDADNRELSWRIARSYQPRNQWPEPARLSFIGNCVIEFAPSGAYVEDWRQTSSRGPLLGLRLVAMVDPESGQESPMDGGLLIAGEHAAFARSRLPRVDAALRGFASLKQALDAGIATQDDIESYEVSVAIGGRAITHGTQPWRRGDPIATGRFSVRADGRIVQESPAGLLLYDLDVFEPDFTFDTRTPTSAEAAAWMEREQQHLARHAVPVS